VDKAATSLKGCEDDDHVAANEDPRRGKARIVLSVLAGEMTCTGPAQRIGVSSAVVTKWKQQFLQAGAERLEEVPRGTAGCNGRHSSAIASDRAEIPIALG
jgi:transposase-like protein